MDLKSINLMKNYLPKDIFAEKGIIESEEDSTTDKEKKEKSFAYVILKDHDQEQQIRELRKEYPSTDNSITLLMDTKGNILKTFHKDSDDSDNDNDNDVKEEA